VVNAIDSIVDRICEANYIARKKIKVHILNKNEVNAFALPNGHLVVFSGLILAAENPEELTGVLGHEIAHIQLNHVMKKLVKEVGFSVLISMTTGNGNGEIIRNTAKMLSSSAFDRGLEKEADIKSVDYLVNAKVAPQPFANFLFKLSNEENPVSKYFTWISTHPESEERAKYILDYCEDLEFEAEPLLSDQTWAGVRSNLQD
jgi:predicted Zn-dependent protease